MSTDSEVMSLSDRIAAMREKVRVPAPPIYESFNAHITLRTIFGLYLRRRLGMYVNYQEEIKLLLDVWYIDNPSVTCKDHLELCNVYYPKAALAGLDYDIQQISFYLNLPQDLIGKLFYEALQNELIYNG